MKRALFIISIALVSILLLIELTARLFFHETLTNTAMRLPVYQPDSVVNYTYIPDYDYVGHGKRFHFNKDGFIGEDFPEKTDQKFRIIFSGDSWVSGSLQSIYFSTFTSDLQTIFDENGYRVEILNCGVDGRDRGYDLFKLVRYKMLALQADMIFLEYNLPLYTDNIVRESYAGYFSTYPRGETHIAQRQKDAIDQLNKWKPIVDVIYPLYITKCIFKLLYRYGRPKPCGIRDYSILYQSGVIRSKHRDSSAITRFTLAESADMVRCLRDSLKKNNISFFLYSIQANKPAYQIAKKYRLPFVDIKAQLRTRNGDILPYDGHPTYQGNRKIAERLFEILSTNNLIPAKYCPYPE